MVQGASLRVLACFSDVEVLGFAELCKRAGYPTDLGGYYIRQLIAGGYMEKIDRGQYRLLPKGKQEMALNYGRHAFRQRPRLGVIIIARQGDLYIVMRRKTQPFIGIAEWPAGIAAGGEKLGSAAQRITRERLGVDVELHMVGFFRRIDTYDGMLFDDKLFAVHVCDVPADAVIQMNSNNGKNIPCKTDQLCTLKNPSQALLDIFQFTQQTTTLYEEHMYELTATDLGVDTIESSVDI